MIHAMRFLATVLLILLGFFFLWYGLKVYGESRPTSQYQTELVKALKTKAPFSWQLLKSSDQDSPFLYAKTQFIDNRWQVHSEGKLIPLEEVLAKTSAFLLLNIDLDKTSNSADLKKIIDKNQTWNRIVFTSRSDGPLKDLRKLSPKWTFTNGEVFLTRFLSLSSIGLPSLAIIKTDILMIHIGKLPKSANLKKLIDEAKRQHKFVIVGPVARPLDNLNPDSWLIHSKQAE